MANNIANFKVGFEPKYQDIFGKALTASKIASFRLESQLAWGKSVDRAKLVLDAVKVRALTRQTDRTIDNLTDTKETITVDKQYGATFALDDWDDLQAGPLKTGETAGEQIALKVKRFVDSDIYNEVPNAYSTFTDGDIGGTAGNPITLSTTNAIQVFTNLLAKLQTNNQDTNNMVVAMDPYMASIVNQTVIGKNIELAGTALKNGYAGSVVGFDTYITNNLRGYAELAMPNQVTANDTITINGVTWTYKASAAAAGEITIGGSAAATLTNTVNAINNSSTGFVALSTANQNIIDALRITATAVSTSIQIVSIGGSRLNVSETITDAADVWSKNRIHSYAGARGGIDVVMQQGVKLGFRDEPKQRTTNVLVDALYGIKTFDDGKQRFLDLQIAR